MCKDFSLQKKFSIKELAITDMEEHTTLSPKHKQTYIWVTKHHHGLKWESGCIEYENIEDICKDYLNNCEICVGRVDQKCIFESCLPESNKPPQNAFWFYYTLETPQVPNFSRRKQPRTYPSLLGRAVQSTAIALVNTFNVESSDIYADDSNSDAFDVETKGNQPKKTFSDLEEGRYKCRIGRDSFWAVRAEEVLAAKQVLSVLDRYQGWSGEDRSPKTRLLSRAGVHELTISPQMCSGAGWKWGCREQLALGRARRRFLEGFRHLSSSPILTLHRHNTGSLDFTGLPRRIARQWLLWGRKKQQDPLAASESRWKANIVQAGRPTHSSLLTSSTVDNPLPRALRRLPQRQLGNPQATGSSPPRSARTRGASTRTLAGPIAGKGDPVVRVCRCRLTTVHCQGRQQEPMVAEKLAVCECVIASHEQPARHMFPPRWCDDKIYFKHVYTKVTFEIGSELIRNTLDDSAPIADFQGNKKRIPHWQILIVQPASRTVHCLILAVSDFLLSPPVLLSLGTQPRIHSTKTPGLETRRTIYTLLALTCKVGRTPSPADRIWGSKQLENSSDRRSPVQIQASAGGNILVSGPLYGEFGRKTVVSRFIQSAPVFPTYIPPLLHPCLRARLLLASGWPGPIITLEECSNTTAVTLYLFQRVQKTLTLSAVSGTEYFLQLERSTDEQHLHQCRHRQGFVAVTVTGYSSTTKAQGSTKKRLNNVRLECTYEKSQPLDESTSRRAFKTANEALYKIDNTAEAVEALKEILRREEEYMAKGSGWTLASSLAVLHSAERDDFIIVAWEIIHAFHGLQYSCQSLVFRLLERFGVQVHVLKPKTVLFFQQGLSRTHVLPQPDGPAMMHLTVFENKLPCRDSWTISSSAA
ncbi:hypothetical protein PR048_022287 [Dryococelus australis]|uniref:Uncharacterized protein n=1 Tax=Dryococelus australis TaxID=614101 RepID=A0ABQ9H0K0_9NEOP|nr:hypothetical protein PR048_022287 [Dryococelus australis]